MAWIVLVVSGVLEAGWAVSLKLSEAFSKLWPTLSFLFLAGVSFLSCSWPG